MSEQGQFDLCPKCGGIARDGACQSCGYEIPGIQAAMEQAKTEQAGQAEEVSPQIIEQQTDVQPQTETQNMEQQAEAQPQFTEQKAENALYTTPDVYQSQTGQDVYQTPDTGVQRHDTGGMFSGERTPDNNSGNAQFGNNQYDVSQYGSNVYSNDSYGNGRNDNNPYNGGQYDASQNVNNTYGSGQYGTSQYGTAQNTNSAYGVSQYGAGQNVNNQYGSSQYGAGQNTDNAYGVSQYGAGQNANHAYGANQYGTGQNMNNPYGGTPYGANQYNNSQYGNHAYDNAGYGANPYGSNQYGNGQNGSHPYGANPYSPYATPPAKKHTGLIIGIIITVVVLFLIAFFALFYHVLVTVTKNAVKGDTGNVEDFSREYYDDDWYREHHDNYDDDDYGYGYDDNYGYDDDYGYDDYNYDDYDYDDDEYYTLHDDIKHNLSYSIEWEDYEYEPDDADVIILVEYPVVVGDNIPNLDKINELFANEVSVFQDYYEEEYSNYMNDEDSYFYVSSMGYVTYMDEDVLSVVYQEYIYSDYYDSAFLYSINIDMKDGVILDNTDIIAVNDDFSVDFRYRSDEQNGSIDALDWMSDQEITQLLASEDSLIIFYTPQGMEIGFNYEDGWVTVTYHDYKDYLKIF